MQNSALLTDVNSSLVTDLQNTQNDRPKNLPREICDAERTRVEQLLPMILPRMLEKKRCI